LAVAGATAEQLAGREQLPAPSDIAARSRWSNFMGWAELIQENDTNAQIQVTYWASDGITENGNNKMPGW
jgi:hypothetical protein